MTPDPICIICHAPISTRDLEPAVCDLEDGSMFHKRCDEFTFSVIPIRESENAPTVGFYLNINDDPHNLTRKRYDA